VAPGAENTLQLLERRLAAIRKARPELEAALALEEQLIRAGLNAAREPMVGTFALPKEKAAARIRGGVPLLHDQPASVDVHFAEDLETQTKLAAIAGAATGGALDPERLFTEAFVQHRDHLDDMAVRAGVDAELLTTLATQAVQPLLRAYAARLLPIVERVDDGTPEGASWQRGYCPVCGAWPLLGELRGVELAAYLRCSGCGSGWRSRRLLCSYCGIDDFRKLRTLQVEGEQRFRMTVCEQCQGYLKVGNAFDPPPPELVILDDLASVHLDVVAIERGYQRPSGTGYVIELAVPEAEWVEELDPA